MRHLEKLPSVHSLVSLTSTGQSGIWEFFLAIKDARMAMRLHPDEPKSLLILAKACYALGWYQLAEISYRNYLHDETTLYLSDRLREGLQHRWEEADDADSQTRDGDRYDFDTYLRKLKLTSEISTTPDKCCDFVGPVVIARSTRIPKAGFGTGRGMFASQHIGEGDLICVCNPLALDVQVPPCSKDIMVSSLSKQLAKVFESSPAARYQIMSMMTGAEHIHVPPKLDVPDMEIFQPSNALITNDMIYNFLRWEDDLEMSHLPRFSEPEGVRTFTCNHSDVESQYGALLRRVAEERIYSRDVMLDGQRRTVSGLWILPAFRNHSCIPNSSETYIGDTMFVRACKPIAEGEEITSAYNSISLPLEARTLELGRKWDGGCKCKRCRWEEALSRNIPELASLSRVYYNLYRKSLTPGRGQAMTDEEYITIGVELENILQNVQADAERKNCVRASFFAIYQHLFGMYVKAGVAAGKRIDFQTRCPSVLSRLAALGTTVHVISANWSRALVYGGLSFLPEERLLVHSKELEIDDAGCTTGYFQNLVTNAFDKEKVQQALRRMMRTEEEKMVVYLGDAPTDLLALLDADLGIVMGQRVALRSLLDENGIQLRPLGEAGLLATGQLTSFRQSGFLFQATGWEDVEACLFGAEHELDLLPSLDMPMAHYIRVAG